MTDHNKKQMELFIGTQATCPLHIRKKVIKESHGMPFV